MRLGRFYRTAGLVVFLLSYAGPRATADISDDDDLSPCNQTTRVVDDLFKTPWGITPRDVQNTALGKHRVPLKWRREEAISYGVEGTSTTLLVEITRGKGPIKLIARDGSLRCIGTQPCDDADCSSVLRIPVHVRATTEDRVVSVEGDSELIVSSRDSTIVLVLYAAQRGTLRIRGTKEKGTVVDSFGIVLGFRGKRTMVGAIGGGYKCGDENCLHIPFAYACFPDKPPFEPHQFIFEACTE